MQEIFKDYPQRIGTFLKSFLLEKKQFLEKVNKWGTDFSDRLIDFSTNGKMVRGSLVLFSQSIFNDNIGAESIKAASAIELFHSGLLIHDDIMDRDLTRRGNPSVFNQYILKGNDDRIIDPHQFGISMGICSGDIGFFLGFELLSSINTDPDLKSRIMRLFSSEFVNVGLGQMQDIYFGQSLQMPEEHEIFNLYLYKTARYTFSLPFMLGALLANADEHRLGQLEKLGEFMGLIFQIRDDEIGIYGDKMKTGKSIGSDIIERKKTIFYSYLIQRAAENEIEKIHKLFRTNRIRQKSVTFLHELIKKYNIKNDINKMAADYNQISKEIIDKMDIKDIYKEMLFKILNYNMQRTA